GPDGLPPRERFAVRVVATDALRARERFAVRSSEPTPFRGRSMAPPCTLLAARAPTPPLRPLRLRPRRGARRSDLLWGCRPGGGRHPRLPRSARLRLRHAERAARSFRVRPRHDRAALRGAAAPYAGGRSADRAVRWAGAVLGGGRD